ncbi:MAG: hypothetical protein KF678_14690 [Phycisphaeraceae bacterium]|nr:hypothetical protein [Phycisphaeraceae bacterium]
MTDRHERYSTGKKGEGQTWAYLREIGYIRPTAAQRKVIAETFASQGIKIHTQEFDVVEARHADKLKSVAALSTVLHELSLFEVKSCGAGRKATVSAGFKSFGFTLTSKEKYNADTLGDRYRFIFFNLRTSTHRVCRLQDFFCDNMARIYQTWSVFIRQDLPELDGNTAGSQSTPDDDSA